MASVDSVLNEGVKQNSKVYDLGWKKEDLPSVHFCHGIKEREGYFFTASQGETSWQDNTNPPISQ